MCDMHWPIVRYRSSFCQRRSTVSFVSNIALQVGYFSLALARETSALCALSESPKDNEVERVREKIVGILKTFPAIETTRDAILE